MRPIAIARVHGRLPVEASPKAMQISPIGKLANPLGRTQDVGVIGCRASRSEGQGHPVKTASAPWTNHRPRWRFVAHLGRQDDAAILVHSTVCDRVISCVKQTAVSDPTGT